MMSQRSRILYGSEVVLQHNNTKTYLASLDREYVHPNTSKQQMVVCTRQQQENNVWIVLGMHARRDDNLIGKPVRAGEVIRLSHKATSRNLHSHGDRLAPITKDQQEVTCFQFNAIGNEDDDWIVECPTDYWLTNSLCQLSHRNTGKRLHSHSGVLDARLTAGEQEVTCFRWQNGDNDWVVISASKSLVFDAHPRNTKWGEILSVVGSIASITGWSIVTSRASLIETQWSQIVARIVSALLVVGTIAFAASFIYPLIKTLSGERRLTLRYLGFCLAAVAITILFALANFRLIISLSDNILAPFIRWSCS